MIVFFRKILKPFAAVVILLSVVSLVFLQTDEINAAVAQLSSPDNEVRLSGLYTLAQAKDDERSVEPLITALNDPDDFIRERAADILGFRKEARAVSALIPLLKDRNKSVSFTTAGALGNIGDPIAVQSLIEYLNDNPKSHGGTCNYAAIQALGKFNDERAVMPLFSQMGNECNSSEIPKAIGSAGVGAMIEVVKSGSPSDRAHAVYVLMFIADECAVDALISALGDKNSAYNAYSALVRIGRPAVEPLRLAFENPDHEVKAYVIYALVRIPDESAGEALVGLVRDKGHPMWVRQILVEKIVESKRNRLAQNSDHLVTALLAAMGDSDPHIRNLAIRGLADEQREDVFAAIIEAMSDPATSAEASIVVGQHKDLRALPYLLEALRSDPNAGRRVGQALSSLGEPAVDGLISILTSKNKEFPLREQRRRSEEAGMFMCGNDEPRPNLDPRFHAALALGEIGDDRARITLTKALKDKSEWLRQAAETALNNLGK